MKINCRLILISCILSLIYCTTGYSQDNHDDTLKNYLYTKKQGSIYDAYVNGKLVITDENGKVIFNEDDGIPNMELFNEYVNLAANLFKNGKYYASSKLYEKAIVVNIGKARVIDRYTLARCYAKIGKQDAALTQLEIIAEKSRYYNYEELNRESDFTILHTYEKWQKIVKLVQQNQHNIEGQLNQQLPVPKTIKQ